MGKQWAFVLGWRREEDEDGKEMRIPFSTQVYPPPVVIDAKLLPPLEDSQGDAMKKIMGSPTIPQAQKMGYFNAWQKAKKTGEMPAVEALTKDMSLRDILVLMEKKADDALQKGTIEKKWGKAISGLAGRKFWV